MRGIRFAIAFAVAWSLQAGVSFAAADWLDKLSGPGPFKELFAGYRFLCISNSADQQGAPAGNNGEVLTTWLRPWDRTATVIPAPVPTFESALQKLRDRKGNDYQVTDLDRRKVRASLDCRSDQRLRGYLVANVFYKRAPGFFTSGTDDNDLVEGDVDVKHVGIVGFDVGYVNRLSNAFDIGLAVGFKHFTGLAFGSFDKVYFAPTLEFAPGAIASDGRSAHVVKVVIGARMFLGEFESSNFCKPELSTAAHPFRCPNPTWRSGGHYELVPTIGLIVDPSVLW